MSRVLWFHPRSWGPPRGGGDLRTQGLIRCALQAGHEVVLVAPRSVPDVEPPEGLRLLRFTGPTGVRLSVAKLISRHPLRSPRTTGQNRELLTSEIGSFGADLAVVSEVMSWSIAEQVLPGDLPFVYDAANVESVLFKDLANRARGLDRITFGVDARRVARDERELLRRASAVLAVSEQEREVLVGLAPGVSVDVVPSSTTTPDQPWVVEQSEPSVLFVGTLDYLPNVDAVRELATIILPGIRRRAEARLVVVGRKPVRSVRSLAEAHPWVELHEDVPDLESFYRHARCVVLPIRSGGGTKLKVYEALSYGIPVVATPQALAGVPLEVGAEALVSADSSALAEHAAQVLDDDGFARRLGAAGRTAFTDRLSWERAAMDPLDRVIRGLAQAG